MTVEEVKNETDDMLIDQQRPGNGYGSALHDEFNPNYLKIYYGYLLFLFFLLHFKTH